MSETKKLLYTVSFQPNIVGNFAPDIIIFKNVSHLKIVLESSGELCQVKQRGGIGSKNRRNERRQEKIKKEPNRNTKKEENEKEKIEKETEDEKNINNVQTMEEWKNEKEIRKAARLEARAKDDQKRRQYKEERALFEDDLKKPCMCIKLKLETRLLK